MIECDCGCHSSDQPRISGTRVVCGHCWTAERIATHSEDERILESLANFADNDEVATLREENTHLRAERDQLQAYANTVPDMIEQATASCSDIIAQQRKEIEDWKAGAQVEASEGDAVRAELRRQRPVIDAVRALRDNNYTDNWSAAIAEVLKAVRELDG